MSTDEAVGIGRKAADAQPPQRPHGDKARRRLARRLHRDRTGHFADQQGRMIDLRRKGHVVGGDDEGRLNGLERGAGFGAVRLDAERESGNALGTAIVDPAGGRFAFHPAGERAVCHRSGVVPSPHQPAASTRTQEGQQQKVPAAPARNRARTSAPSHALAVRLHHAERRFRCHLSLFARRVRRFQDLWQPLGVTIVPRWLGC